MKKLLSLGILALSITALAACRNDVSNTTKDSKGTMKIVAPSGAPALSQVKLAYDTSTNDNYTIGGYKIEFQTVNGADGVKAALTSKTHDVVVAPINLGATIYKSNQTYRFAANVTNGNLFLASTTEIHSIDELKGKNLVLFGENTINQVVVEKVFTDNGIDTAGIKYLSSTQLTQAALVADAEQNTVYLVAEPVLSAAKTKLQQSGKNVYTLDIQEEFKKVSSNMDFLQAGVFVKDGIDKTFVDAYLKTLKESIHFVNQNHELVAEYATELELGLPPKAVLIKAIPGCNLVYLDSTTARPSFEALANLGLKYFGGSLPSEEFYFKK